VKVTPTSNGKQGCTLHSTNQVRSLRVDLMCLMSSDSVPIGCVVYVGRGSAGVGSNIILLGA
jgi:hypothetical protein